MKKAFLTRIIYSRGQGRTYDLFVILYPLIYTPFLQCAASKEKNGPTALSLVYDFFC